jgi:hypothetical protein
VRDDRPDITAVEGDRTVELRQQQRAAVGQEPRADAAALLALREDVVGRHTVEGEVAQDRHAGRVVGAEAVAAGLEPVRVADIDPVGAVGPVHGVDVGHEQGALDRLAGAVALAQIEVHVAGAVAEGQAGEHALDVAGKGFDALAAVGPLEAAGVQQGVDEAVGLVLFRHASQFSDDA